MSNSTYVLDDKLLVSAGARFLHYIIDLLAFFVILILIGAVIGVLSALLDVTALSDWMNGLGDLGWNLIAIIVSLIYYIAMEGLLGRTLGKYITGSIVVDENGQKPDFGTIVKEVFAV